MGMSGWAEHMGKNHSDPHVRGVIAHGVFVSDDEDLTLLEQTQNWQTA